MQIKFFVIWMHCAVGIYRKSSIYQTDNFQFIGGMKFGEPSADGRGSAPPELAEQQARAGSEAAPATPPL